MSVSNLGASVRDSSGKGVARRLRATGRIPAVAYGKDMESRSLSISPKELRSILGGDKGLNTVIHLEIEGEKEAIPTLVADYQIHPVTRSLLHADFKRIDLEQPVDVEVPLELTGRAKGVVAGGKLSQVYRQIPIRCKPLEVPVKLVHDITELGVDQVAEIKDLALPEGVEARMPANRTIVGIYADKRRKDDSKAEEGAAEK